MVKNEMKKQTSQEWEIARYNRERNKWADRKARWAAYKSAQAGAIYMGDNNNSLSN